MRVLIDAAARWSGGYLSHLKGILSSRAIPTDVEVIVVCSPKMAKALGTVDPQVTYCHLFGTNTYGANKSFLN